MTPAVKLKARLRAAKRRESDLLKADKRALRMAEVRKKRLAIVQAEITDLQERLSTHVADT